jgi:NarL family two-component system response regulator LiaR
LGTDGVTTETSGPTDGETIRVVLSEGDRAARERLAAQLAELTSIDLVAVEATGNDTIVAAYRSRPDIVLLDLTPPDRTAADTIRHLQRVCPGVSVAMLVDKQEDARLTPALDAGARESVLKDVPAERLEAVLRRLGPNTFPGQQAPAG